MIKNVERIIASLQENKKDEKFCSWDKVFDGMRRLPVSYIDLKKLHYNKCKHNSDGTPRIPFEDAVTRLHQLAEFACLHDKIWAPVVEGVEGVNLFAKKKILICPTCGTQLAENTRTVVWHSCNYSHVIVYVVSFGIPENLTTFLNSKKWGLSQIRVSQDGKSALIDCTPFQPLDLFFDALCEQYPDITIESRSNEGVYGYGDCNGYTPKKAQCSSEVFQKKMEKKYGPFNEPLEL